MKRAYIWLVLLSHFGFSLSQGINSARCPSELGWVSSGLMCYKFTRFPELNYRDAVKYCQGSGATLVSVDESKHKFIKTWLERNDMRRNNWWTSGRIHDGKVHWEGNGSKGLYDKAWVVPVSEYQRGHHNIFYKYDDTEFGWAVGNQWTSMSCICEINIKEVYRIAQEKRGFDYGLQVQNPSEAPRGPFFIVEPESVTILSRTKLVYFHCVAGGNPTVTYQWLKQNVDRKMEPLVLKDRYTTVSGTLQIENPSSANRDQATFQCKVTNEFGTIVSSPVELSFGSISNFSTVASADVDANEQMGAQLECPSISGLPGLYYQWYKNSPTSFIRPNIQTHSFISASGKLLFSEVTESDEGIYYCVASLTGFGLNRNYLGSSQTVSKLSRGFKLNVKKSGGNDYGVDIQKEFIYVYPKIPMKGSTVMLECFAYGSLPLTYTWGKVNRPFPEGRHKFDSANRILKLYDVDLSDEDTYFCNVSSSKTNSKESTSLALEIQTKPFFIYPLDHQHIDIGTQLTWHCEAIGKPFPVYFWYKDGKKLSSSADLKVSGNTITISSVDPKHNGMYQCGAKNEWGESFSTAQLRVLEIKPSFEKSPMTKFVTGAIGGNVTLHCDPIGAPRPDFTWFKDDTSINFNDHYQLLLSGDLFIAQITVGDEGAYKCHVENGLGKAEDYTDFKVNERAQFYQKPRNDEVEVNLTVTLMCQASHAQNTDMIYIWSFNDHVIDFEREPEYRLGRGKEEGYLYVTSAQFRNEGRYTCAIVSALDTQEESCYLTVKGPPGEQGGLKVHKLHPVNELRSSQNTDLATTRWLSWYDGASHGKEPVTHYFIEFRTDLDRNWRIHPDGNNIPVSETTVEDIAKLHYARVTNLKAGRNIQFRILARNAYGIGAPSLPTIWTGIDSAPPSKKVSNIRGGGGSIQTLTIWWDPLPPEDHNGPKLSYKIGWRLYNASKPKAYNYEQTSHDEACQAKVNIKMGRVFVCQYVITIEKIDYYKRYDVTIQAHNAAGFGPQSDTSRVMSAETLPQGSVSTVYGLEYNSTALMIFWDPVENVREAAGGALKGYKINYWRRDFETEGEALQNIVELKEGQRNLDHGMIIGLTPITWYSFNVQAFNSAGNGGKSGTYEQQTLNNVPGLFPTEVYVYSIEGKGVQVKFRGITTRAREEPLQGYKIQIWKSNENIRSAREYDLGKKNSGTIRNLNSSVLYQLRVFAYSRAGQGKRSSPTVFFTVGDGQILSNPETTEIMAGASAINPLVMFTLLLIILATWLQSV